MLHATSLFDLTDFDHRTLFPENCPPWTALENLKNYMETYPYPLLDPAQIPLGKPLEEPWIFYQGSWMSGENCTIESGKITAGELVIRQKGRELPGASVVMAGATLMGQHIALGKGIIIEPCAMIKSPAIIGDYSEIRHGAYLRGYCLTGKRCVLGHSTEVKHSIFLNDAKAGHFAYLGDSILGGNANLGAGTKLANLRFIKGNISIKYGTKSFDTKRRKLGAILGDQSLTGCNSVTNPGTVFGKQSMLMPNSTAKSGYYPEKSLVRG